VSRSQRLLKLIHLLRSHRFPVTGAKLAESLDISLRTLYRDIATLQEQGAHIEGEPGLGYVLKPGFMLPPLMFSEDEIEALVLGSRWVAQQSDQRLSEAAQSALVKIANVLPSDLRDSLDANSLLVVSSSNKTHEVIDLSLIRQTIRSEHKASICYRDLKEQETTRLIWPFALGYFDHVRVLVAWCELRQGFRHFRTDRITRLTVHPERYPRRKQVLLKEWRQSEGISNTTDKN
jgi:predicted DNA-binding transcriptional regulator YafY